MTKSTPTATAIIVGCTIIAVTVMTIGYTLPFCIAYFKCKKDVAAISVLNIFLGWTLIGWAVALVWAFKQD